MPNNYDTRVGPGGSAQMYVNGQWLDANLFSPGTGLQGPLSPKQEANAGYAPGSMQTSSNPYLGETPDPGSNLFEPWRTPAYTAPPTPAIATPKANVPTPKITPLGNQNRADPLGATKPQYSDALEQMYGAQAKAKANSRYNGLANQASLSATAQQKAGERNIKPANKPAPGGGGGHGGYVPPSSELPPGSIRATVDIATGIANAANATGSGLVQTSQTPLNTTSFVAGNVDVANRLRNNPSLVPGAEPNRWQALADSGKGGPVGKMTGSASTVGQQPNVKPVVESYNAAQAALADSARWTGAAIFNYGERPNVITQRLVEELPYKSAGFNDAQEFLVGMGYMQDPQDPNVWVRLDPVQGGGGGSGGNGYGGYYNQPLYDYGGGYGYGNSYGHGYASSRGGGYGSGGYQGGGGLIRWNIR